VPAVSEPVISDVGVLAMIPDAWETFWQPRHHVLSRLSRFFRIVWLEPAADWRQLRPGMPPFPPAAPPPLFHGLTPYPSQSWPPRFYRPAWLANAFFRERLRRARNWLRAQNCEKIILYVWRPEFASALRAVPHDLSCYHIDDEYRFSSVDAPTSERELALLGEVDQVFIHSRTLLQKKGAINRHTSFVPNGVDFAAYATPAPEPADLACIPHPRIGYTGYLKKQLDWELLLRLAAEHSHWSFVFVGPQLQHAEIPRFMEQLSRFGNVHFLGSKPTAALAAYPQHFDVSIMPYRLDGYTKYIYPLKLHEYLAAGKPTIGARIPTIEEFSDVVALPATYSEWSAAIAEALRPAANDEVRRQARRSVARQHDWETIVFRLAATLAARLGHNYPAQLAEWAAQSHFSASHIVGDSFLGR
jgi:glycosyltransferase involved in cell wall biosynthesis